MPFLLPHLVRNAAAVVYHLSRLSFWPHAEKNKNRLCSKRSAAVIDKVLIAKQIAEVQCFKLNFWGGNFEGKH